MVDIEVDEFYNNSFGTVIKSDCLEIMPYIKDKSIDMILCDLPYGETGNKWDFPINPKELWKQYERIITEEGCIALNGTFKFGTQLYQQAPHLYKYDWVWEKDNGTNATTVNYQPFRIHEFVFIFGKGRVSNGKRVPMLYNPQKTDGKSYKCISGKQSENWKGGFNNIETNNESGLRHPKTIQKFNRDKGLHPTQKPIALYEYLIRTYTNEGMVVLDNCAGSGTTGVAASSIGRNFILIEKEEKYCDIIKKRLSEMAIPKLEKEFSLSSYIKE